MILDQSAASSYSALSSLRSRLSTTFSPDSLDKPGFLLIGHSVERTPGCLTGEASLTAGRPRGLGSEGSLVLVYWGLTPQQQSSEGKLG